MKFAPYTVCTPPATKGAARAVAAPAAPALGVCTPHMNRHQLSRLASYCRSKRLILHSLITSAAATANAAHPTNPNAAITDIATCTAVTPDMWVQFTLTLVGALTGFCALGLFVAQALWFGVVAPRIALRVNASIMRSDKALDAVVDARLRRREAARAGQAERRTSRAAINFGGCVAPRTASVPDGNHGDNFPESAA